MFHLLALILATPVAELEVGMGANLCGAHGAVQCTQAQTGLAFDLRSHSRLLPWLGLGASLSYLTLPIKNAAAGNLFFVGPEVSGYLPITDTLSARGALAIGFNRLAGVGGQESGFGGLDLHLGVRYRFWPQIPVSFDYGLLSPQLGERCTVNRCGALTAALMHRFTVGVGLAW